MRPFLPTISLKKPAKKSGSICCKAFTNGIRIGCSVFFGYDLKNETERLQSNNIDGGLHLPDMFFVRPDVVIALPPQGHAQIEALPSHPISAVQILKEINEVRVSETSFPKSGKQVAIAIPKARMSKAEYIRKLKAIRQHIAKGDVYEFNLCMEFFAENVELSPLRVFERLNRKAKAPFSVYAKTGSHRIISISPERFLQKTNDLVISQPIKGTIRRGEDLLEDEILKTSLKNDPKERAENVMIVDLVRNDLTRGGGELGSIKVPELFGLHSFETVHHLISTVSANLPKKEGFAKLLKSAFPPGSMTGAPKIMAMELIEQYEISQRGLYAGSIGYFTPTGNFDFNVVIRTLLFNKANGYLSFHTGGAITYSSQPEKEYAECLLKAQALLAALENEKKA